MSLFHDDEVRSAPPNIPLDALNEARFSAFKHCADAVELLAKVMNDPEVDLDQRCICAAELLQFVAKGF